eukprot:3858215-Heterocapsa_arctica.AAC.1
MLLEFQGWQGYSSSHLPCCQPYLMLPASFVLGRKDHKKFDAFILGRVRVLMKGGACDEAVEIGT